MKVEQELLSEQLKLIEHYFDWQNQIDACEQMQELSKLEIQKAIEALRFLKEFLGEDFPKNCQEKQHPICQYFWNKAPWTREWFTWIAHCLRELHEAKHFEEVLTKFKNNKDEGFAEAISLFESALKFRQAGFTVNFEEETTNAKGTIMSPDIELTNPVTSEKIYAEITRLTADPTLEQYGDITRRIIHGGLVTGKYLNFSGRLFKRLSNEHWNEILNEVDQKIIWSAKNNSFQEIIQKGTIELAIAPMNNLVLAEWSAEKRYDINSFQLPPSSPFDRIRSKILHKSRQNSVGHANILVIRHEDASYHFVSPEEYISNLEETIYKCPDLAAVIIVGYEFGGREKKIDSHGMSYLIQKTERHAWSSRTVVILNKFYSKKSITLHSINKLIDSFL